VQAIRVRYLTDSTALVICSQAYLTVPDAWALELRSSSVAVHSGLPSRTRSGGAGVDGVDGVDYGVV